MFFERLAKLNTSATRSHARRPQYLHLQVKQSLGFVMDEKTQNLQKKKNVKDSFPPAFQYLPSPNVYTYM